jgi:hypothetical protein
LAKGQREVTVFTPARFLPRALPFLVVVAMLPAPVPAAAWAAPPTLNNESFVGGANLNTSGCALLGGGTFGFSASGSATGPAYPGPFSESGSVTVTGISVTGFTASFSISPTGAQSGDTVVGKKMWAPPAGLLGVCLDGLALNVHSTYSAVITLPSGERFCDVGTSLTSLGNPMRGNFTESFTSNLSAPTRMGLTSTCP